MTSQNTTESIIKCRHCGVPIGEVTDPWGGKHGWTHRPEDGPDAYTNCVCKCSSTNPLCIEGEEAEPELSLVDGLLLTVDRVTPDCTCPDGYFWREKVHSPLCARRIATQEQSNEAAMAQFNVGARSSRISSCPVAPEPTDFLRNEGLLNRQERVDALMHLIDVESEESRRVR